MKGLAWYSVVLLVIANIVLLVDLLQGTDISTSVWGIALNTPIIVFFVLYLKERG